MSIFGSSPPAPPPTTGAGSTLPTPAAPGPTPPSAVPSAGLLVAGTTAPCNRFEGRIIRIMSIANSVDVTVGGAVVAAPYWIYGGASYEDGANSTHPAAVPTQAGSDLEMSVKVDVTKADGLSGSGELIGTLSDGTVVEFKGVVPMSVGVHTVTVKLDRTTTRLARHRGDIAWQVIAPGCGTHNVGRSRVEIYRIVEDTRPPYLTAGRPAEALRFLYERMGAGGADVAGKNPAGIRDTTDTITTYCHGPHGMTYDTFRGGVGFLTIGRRGSTFALTDYMTLKGTNTNAAGTVVPNMVNCYDQASAVLVFAGIMGIDGHKRYVEPFGYITTTILVGGIRSNNPFHSGVAALSVLPQMDPRRTSFGNHEFYMDSASAVVFDACAGPHLGTEDYYNYLNNSVDTAMPTPSGAPGTAAKWRLEWRYGDDYFKITAIT